jgi:hypothetical protein
MGKKRIFMKLLFGGTERSGRWISFGVIRGFYRTGFQRIVSDCYGDLVGKVDMIEI